jgi:hypothetical protein
MPSFSDFRGSGASGWVFPGSRQSIRILVDFHTAVVRIRNAQHICAVRLTSTLLLEKATHYDFPASGSMLCKIAHVFERWNHRPNAGMWIDNVEAMASAPGARRIRTAEQMKPQERLQQANRGLG